MKKRIIFYGILLLIIFGFIYFNYGFEIKTDNAYDINITKEKGVITVSGKIDKKFYSVSTENDGGVVYISLKGKNSFKNNEKCFEVNIENINNSVKKVYLKDKKNTKLIYKNPDYGKIESIFGETLFSN